MQPPRAPWRARVTWVACACPRPGAGTTLGPLPRSARTAHSGRAGAGQGRGRRLGGGGAEPGSSEWPRARAGAGGAPVECWGGPGLSMEQRGGGEGSRAEGAPTSKRCGPVGRWHFIDEPQFMEGADYCGWAGDSGVFSLGMGTRDPRLDPA